MTTHLGLQRILLPSAQVSQLATGSITLPSARGAFVFPVDDFSSIASTTLSSSATSITLSSIPQTFKHLHIRFSGRKDTTGANQTFVRLNGNTGYFSNDVVANSSTVSQSRATGYTNFEIYGASSNSANPSNVFGVAIIEILDYSNSAKIPLMGSRSGNASRSGNYALSVSAGQGKQTFAAAAVTSVTILSDDGNFVAGTSLEIYGIG
jgi:hypothetical protein